MQKFLVGNFCDKVPDSQLPTGRDVLKYLYHKTHEASLKSRKSPSTSEIVACHLDRKIHASMCAENASCTENPLVLLELSRSHG